MNTTTEVRFVPWVHDKAASPLGVGVVKSVRISEFSTDYLLDFGGGKAEWFDDALLAEVARTEE